MELIYVMLKLLNVQTLILPHFDAFLGTLLFVLRMLLFVVIVFSAKCY